MIKPTILIDFKLLMYCMYKNKFNLKFLYLTFNRSKFCRFANSIFSSRAKNDFSNYICATILSHNCHKIMKQHYCTVKMNDIKWKVAFFLGKRAFAKYDVGAGYADNVIFGIDARFRQWDQPENFLFNNKNLL